MNKYLKFCNELSKVISLINIVHPDWIYTISKSKTLEDLNDEILKFIEENKDKNINKEIEKYLIDKLNNEYRG